MATEDKTAAVCREHGGPASLVPSPRLCVPAILSDSLAGKHTLSAHKQWTLQLKRKEEIPVCRELNTFTQRERFIFHGYIKTLKISLSRTSMFCVLSLLQLLELHKLHLRHALFLKWKKNVYFHSAYRWAKILWEPQASWFWIHRGLIWSLGLEL